MKELAKIQQELDAPKGQYNNFGKYYYRSCEDILGAVKPLLGNCILTLTDEPVEIGGRVYIKATANLCNGNEAIAVSAVAREAEDKKGMDAAQLSGATSSYARKYALNGLFAIDDAKDEDTPPSARKKPEAKADTEMITDDQIEQLESLKQAGGYSDERLRDGCVWAGNVQSPIDLTKAAADKLIKQMRKGIEENS